MTLMGRYALAIMAVGGFFHEGQQGQQTDADHWNENRREPFDLADHGDLPIERQEFEEEEEIPLGAREVGSVARVGFGFSGTPIKVASSTSRMKMPSETITSLKMLSGQKNSPLFSSCS